MPLKAPEVKVCDCKSVAAESAIVEHVALAFVVQYHRNFEVSTDNHLHGEVDQV